MSYKITIIDEAKIDYRKSLFWYKDINPKIAVRFNNSFKNSLKEIKNNPYQFQVRYKDIRIKLLDKFPYVIHYAIYNNTIVVKLICHTSRDGELNMFQKI